MKAINRFRFLLGLSKIRNKLTGSRRGHKLIRWIDARKVTVLIPVNGLNAISFANQLEKILTEEGKNVKIVGYSDTELVDKGKLNPSIDLISKKDTTWIYLPKSEIITTITPPENDILVNLCTEICLPLLYITAISKSFFKIGKYHPNLADYYDFMIDSREHTPDGLWEEVKRYLYTIK